MTDSADAGSVAAEAQPAGNPATPQTPAENGSAAGTASWIDGLSEGNRQLAENKGWKSPEDIDKVFSSYAELEKMQGNSLRAPADDAPKEEWDKFYSKLPEALRPVDAPEKIEFKRPEGVPEDLPYDGDLANAAKQWAVDAKLSPAAAQVMHDKFVAYTAERMQESQQAVAKSVEDTHAALTADPVHGGWGAQDSEGFKKNHQLADTAIKKLELTEAFQKSGIILPDGTLTDAKLAKAFAQIGEAMFREDTIGGQSGGLSGENPFKVGADGKPGRNMSAISAIAKRDPNLARRYAREAGENPDEWFPNNPL